MTLSRVLVAKSRTGEEGHAYEVHLQESVAEAQPIGWAHHGRDNNGARTRDSDRHDCHEPKHPSPVRPLDEECAD
jgi:hypothetical protein